MIEKRRCPNCGAFLDGSDSRCYVCGEEVGFDSARPTERNKVVYEPEQFEDFVKPVSYDEASGVELGDRLPYNESDYVEPYNDDPEPEKEKGSKKVLIACIAVVVVALIGAAAFCFAAGVFDKKDDETVYTDKMTVFFDKPSDKINLFDAKKNVYLWSGDVVVCYTSKGKQKEKDCKENNKYTNLWEVELPDDAHNISFRNAENSIKTETIASPEDGEVYYVADAVFGKNGLSLSRCDISEFKNLGINYSVENETVSEATAPSETSEKTTESESEASTETVTEKTEAENYTVTLPDEWRNNAVDIETDGNRTIYYDNYNHSMYDMGMLLAIYVYDAGDSSYKEKKYEKAIKSSDGSKIIVVETPSGIEFVDSDEKAMESYTSLSNYTSQVINSIVVK